jgi:hypothetical protein
MGMRPGQRNRGTFVKGDPRQVPGGMTSEQRKARDVVQTALSSAAFSDAWKAGYLELLQAKNPFILKDYADRVGGKPKETVELEVKSDPLADVPDDVLVAFVTRKP